MRLSTFPKCCLHDETIASLLSYNKHTTWVILSTQLTSFQSSSRTSWKPSSRASPPSSAGPSSEPPSSQSSAPRWGKRGECYLITPTIEQLPILQALVAEIATISTRHSALAVGHLSQVAHTSTRNLSISPFHEETTPARAFLQQPHFTALTLFLL